MLDLDGRFVVAEAMFILAWRVVGVIGIQRLLARGLRAVRHTHRPARRAPALQPVPLPVRPSRVRRR